jgi:hypothetical protein
MRISNKRDILKWFNEIRAGDGRRFIGRIQVKPVSQSPYAAPLDATSERLDPSTDTVFQGAGIFGLTGDSADPELFDSVIKRTGQLDVHPQYEQFFRQAYSVQVGGEKGSFEVVGVDTGVNKITCHVKLKSRQ